MTHKINHANIKEWAKNYDGPLFDGILCDPPYELGFMGKSWDSSGIAFDVEMWKSLYDLLKPGAHLLAFSGSRTYHRMAVAIEDAGFEIRDMIEWVYGSGFPKSLNIGKAVDKIQGNEREEYNPGGRYKYSFQEGNSQFVSETATKSGKRMSILPTKGTSEWEGYGTALKPAHEPCLLARKPLDGTVANNVLKHGTGGLNIDGARVAAEPELAKNWTDRKAPAGFNGDKSGIYGSGKTDTPSDYTPTGRFPANLIHDGSDEVEAVFPQTGKSPKPYAGDPYKDTSMFGIGGVNHDTEYGDSGSASRYFYCAKASKSERNAGLDNMPDMPMAMSNQAKAELKRGNTDFAGHKEGDWNGVKMLKNHHPTVKPLSLTKYLATLIKPPTGGRLLVPFSGSGSEMIGALQAGWEYVEGVELTEEYIPIAEARIKHWIKEPVQQELV